MLKIELTVFNNGDENSTIKEIKIILKNRDFFIESFSNIGFDDNHETGEVYYRRYTIDINTKIDDEDLEDLVSDIDKVELYTVKHINIERLSAVYGDKRTNLINKLSLFNIGGYYEN